MKLHVAPPSPNARKTMTANGLLGLNIETILVDIRAGAHKSAEFVVLNPNCKIPVLELDDGTSLWESNAIINRMAAEVDTDFWPKSNARYDIMRWQFWESAHWQPACSQFIAKHIFGNDDIDIAKAEEGFKTLGRVLDGHLASREWLVGDKMTNADISVSAYLCYRAPCHYPMSDFAHINRWLSQIEGESAWKLANAA